MYVDTTFSHRKWFVNNTLPVTGANSVQTDGDLLHGWRVQLFWRLISGRTKQFPAASWILQPPWSRSGTLSPSLMVPADHHKDTERSKSKYSVILLHHNWVYWPFTQWNGLQTVQRWHKTLFCLELRGQYFLMRKQQQFQKKMAFAPAMKKFWLSQNGFLQVELFWSILARNKWLGRLQKDCT